MEVARSVDVGAADRFDDDRFDEARLDDDRLGGALGLAERARQLIALALAAVVAPALLTSAWRLHRRTQRKNAATRWDDRRAALLEDAQRAHNGAIDLASRWVSYGPEQLQVAWSTEMAGLARLRSRLSGLLASAPAGEATADMQNVTRASDDLHLALGHAEIGRAVHPPAEAIGAAERLDRAIYEAQHGVASFADPSDPADPHAHAHAPAGSPGVT